MEYFASNIKYLRKSSGMTQAEIKDSLGIEGTTWGNYERGQSFPNLTLFSEIVKYFGISAHDLLFADMQKGNLNEKLDDQKNQEKGKLISNPIGKVKTQKEGKSPPPYNFEMPFNQALNDPETPYGILHQQIAELTNKIADFEANTSKRFAQMEDKIKALSKEGPKK